MILVEELRSIAKLKGIKNLGYAEKDYLIELALLLISRQTKDEIVFKGGTCLYKFYKLGRFSEDIDFTLKKELNIDILIKTIILGLSGFGIEADVKKKKQVQNSVMITLRTKGPLYANRPQTFSSIGIDINIKSSIDVEPVNSRYSPIYKEVPPFSMLIMDEKEILAEKVRAILSRDKARDVYDLWFLIQKEVKADAQLINKKLDYYNMKFSVKELKKAIEAKKGFWEKELEPLVFGELPSFGECRKRILEAFSGYK